VRAATRLAISSRETAEGVELGVVGDVGETSESIAVSRTRRRARESALNEGCQEGSRVSEEGVVRIFIPESASCPPN
jgi:hypothetical protein